MSGCSAGMHLGSGGCAVEMRLFNIGIVDCDGDKNDDDDDQLTKWASGLSGCNAGVRVDAASRCTCSGGYDALQSFENAAEISDRSAAATAVLLIALLVIQGQ